jgi:thiamine-phosphate pyrophosphorylase
VNSDSSRLYLTIARADDPGLGEKLRAALGAADVAAVLLRLPDAPDETLAELVRKIAPSVQDKGAALLLGGHPDLAVRAGADGVHFSDVVELKAGIAALKPDRIAGAGGLRTRHDAMLAGEMGADYVMFGEPDAEGRRPPFGEIIERIEWWADLFSPPCVGYAISLDEIEAFAAAGADFVALGDFVFADERPERIIMAAAERLKGAQRVR